MIRVLTPNPTKTVKINHIGNTPPSSPWTGMLWFDTSTNPPVLKYYDGTGWQTVSSSSSVTGYENLIYSFFFGGD